MLSVILCDDKELKLLERFKYNINARLVRIRNVADVAVFFGPAVVWGWRSPPSPPVVPPLGSVTVCHACGGISHNW